MMNGVYRAMIEDVNDPERRFRYRVRVVGVDFDATPVTALRWAECSTMFSAKLAGDLPNYDVGDRVFVMFEQGNVDFPVIMGGWVTNSLNVPDVPTAQGFDYLNNRKRWLRVDRKGNTIELSEVPEELWVRMVSGAAEITVSQADGAVRLYAKSSVIDMAAKSVTQNAETILHRAETIIITADGLNSLGGADGLMMLISNFELNLHADGPTGAGTINIGGYVPSFQGVTNVTPAMAPKQTKLTNMLSRDIRVGQTDGDVAGLPPLPLLPTEKIRLRAKSIDIGARPLLADIYPLTPVKININAVDGDIEIITNQKVKVTAGPDGVEVNSAGPVNVNALGDVVVTTPEQVTVNATIVLVTASVVTIDAPVINVGVI